MKKSLAAVLLFVVALSFNGCCCCNSNWCDCCDVPVDCEDFCNCLHHTNCKCAHTYPYSCPPCPYYDAQNCYWHPPYFLKRQQQPTEAAAPEPTPAATTPGPTPEPAVPNEKPADPDDYFSPQNE